jgi:hypothetical protein
MQYAVTEYSHLMNANRPDSVPGIFVQFEIEPITLQITASKLGTIQFITRLCGVFGGVFVVVGMLLHFSQWVSALLNRQFKDLKRF